MTLEKKINVQMEIWCSDPREFQNLMALLNERDFFGCVNGTFGGYGFNLEVEDLSERDVRKVLGFKKSEV